MKSKRAVWASLALALCASACSSEQAGTPRTPDSTSPNAGASNSAAPSSSSNDIGSQLAGTDPCSLLSTSELGEFGVYQDRTEPKSTGSTRGCQWYPDREKTPPNQQYSITVTIADHGIKDAVDQGYGVQSAEENGRHYAQVPSDLGCLIAIGVTDDARVDVAAFGPDGDQQNNCRVADDAAALVEPKLPQG